MTNSETKRDTLTNLAADVESTMRELGIWDASPDPPPAPIGPFGAGSMAFERWLQHVFLPRLTRAALTNSYPQRSQVAVAAARNLDGIPKSERLVELLARIDRVIETE